MNADERGYDLSQRLAGKHDAHPNELGCALDVDILISNLDVTNTNRQGAEDAKAEDGFMRITKS